MKKVLKITGTVLLTLILPLALLFGYWFFHPNRAVVDAGVVMAKLDLPAMEAIADRTDAR